MKGDKLVKDVGESHNQNTKCEKPFWIIIYKNAHKFSFAREEFN